MHTVPTVPLFVAATAGNLSGSLMVSWEPPTYLNAPNVSYVVLYRVNTSTTHMTVTTGNLTRGVLITSLIPATNYTIQVQACSRDGCGELSDNVSALTREEGMTIKQLLLRNRKF